MLTPAEKALKKEKKAALDDMVNVYQESRDGQAAVESIYEQKYAHLGRYQRCNACEANEPHIDNICCVCSTFNKPLSLTVKVTGLTYDDFLLALDEVKKQLGNEFTEGANENETGSYNFSVKA